MEINDFSKLATRGGRIHYALYQQDGSMQSMDCADTPSNRLFVSWVQKFDRVAHSTHGREWWKEPRALV